MQFNWIDLGLLLISAGALVISLINTRQNVKFNKNQDKLNKIKLSKEEESKAPKVVAEIIPNNTNKLFNYHVCFTNIGGSDAINIDLTIIKSSDWDIDSSMLPYEVLKPKKNFKLVTLNSWNTTGKTLCKISWLDKSGKKYEESAVLSL